MLPQHTWEQLLHEGGFDRVKSFPGQTSPATVLGQQVIVARTTSSISAISGELVEETRFARTEPNTVQEPEAASWLDMPAEQRHDNLVAVIRQQLAEMLRYDFPERIERRRRLIDLGLDSLMALELRNRLTKVLNLERPLSATLVFDYPTMDALADYLEHDVLGFKSESEPASTNPDSLTQKLAARAEELEQMDDEEVTAVLLKKLQSL